jgi:type VI secretion system protein ImpH
LAESACRFEFFQAVRLLRLMRRGAPAPGEGEEPRAEPVRFASDVSLGFPPSDIARMHPPQENGDPPRLAVPFMGVASPASYGSLPGAYTEFVREESRRKNAAPREFLDLFNHRMVALFFRAWEKHRFPIVYERSGGKEGELFEQGLFSLLGLGTPGIRARLPFSDLALLPWSGVVRRGTVPVDSLAKLMESFLDVPVKIEQFVARWHVMEESETCPLGKGQGRLGQDAILGTRLCVSQFSFRVILGPLDRATYRRFLPPGDGFPRLREIVRFAAGAELDFDVRLHLRAKDVPHLRLGSRDPEDAPRLGWLTWLGTRPRDRDACDVIIPESARLPAGATV